MQTNNFVQKDPYTIFDQGWMVRIQPPLDPQTKRVVLLLHGWTGDENVMWFFARPLVGKAWIFSPRAPVAAPDGGYGWLPNHGSLPALDDFFAVSQAFVQAFDRWRNDLHIPLNAVDVIGFSQGAAMAYSLAAYYPDHVHRIASLAGFLPKETSPSNRYQNLAHKQIFIAHGSKDETIPVALAHRAVDFLQSVQAEVFYCESEVGHKLGAECVRSLEKFFADTDTAG